MPVGHLCCPLPNPNAKIALPKLSESFQKVKNDFIDIRKHSTNIDTVPPEGLAPILACPTGGPPVATCCHGREPLVGIAWVSLVTRLTCVVTPALLPLPWASLGISRSRARPPILPSRANTIDVLAAFSFNVCKSS